MKNPHQTRPGFLQISSTRAELGTLAASQIASSLRTRLATQPRVRMVFAAAPSQGEMLQALAQSERVDWTRVDAFHMDEYIGLPEGAPQSFGAWLNRQFFTHVALGSVSLIHRWPDAQQCAIDYARHLAAAPVDFVCLGIGMNGHLAFNDPPASFDEAVDVKVVALEFASRRQQVEEGLFGTIDQVPTHAVTLSIPRLLRADKLFCCVPGRLKEPAVTRALLGPVDPGCPASILRNHPDCSIYLDAESSAGLLEGEP